MGSKLIERELVASKDWAGITAKVEKTIEMIKQIRSGE
jgi:2-keto-3-deoxy-6-phosphogluconate aldolase